MTAHPAKASEVQLLEELAELGMGMARRVHDVAQAADDPEVVARLGAAFHQVSRTVRQSLALQARFAGGWVPRPAANTPERAAAPPASGRERPEATGWNEYERFDSDELAGELDELDDLAEQAEDEPVDPARFEAALEAGVARLRRGVRALRPLPSPTPAPGIGLATTSTARRAALLGGAAVLRVVDSS